MTFDLNFPTEAGDVHPLRLDVGETLFVLGANGTGKSSLMFRFNAQNLGHARKVSAHRQTWMQSDALDLTPSNKLQTEQNIRQPGPERPIALPRSCTRRKGRASPYSNWSTRKTVAHARWRGHTTTGGWTIWRSEAQAESPITVINELLRESHIPIEISIRDNKQVTASKNGGTAVRGGATLGR